jgi:hypothetical protein
MRVTDYAALRISPKIGATSRKLVPLCKEDYAILASLNFTGSPPPGFSGSQFVPLQYPPAKVLKPEKL